MAKDKHSPEEEYFHRTNKEKIAKLKAEHEAAGAAAAAAELKATHHLHCGKCGNKMTTSIFKGIEIEVCPNCGAVLLDPGELEALVGNDEAFHVTLKDFFKFTKRRS
jgi:ribosomal protein S27AE